MHTAMRMAVPSSSIALLACLLVIAGTHIVKALPADNDNATSWSYQGATGAEHWHELSTDFRGCEAGRSQSPLNLDDPASASAINSTLPSSALITTQWPVDLDACATFSSSLASSSSSNSSVMNLSNLGHTLQLGMFPQSGGCRVVTGFDGGNYTLVQVHFHTPSEHHVEGRFYPMEVHLVHADTNGKYLVLGLFYDLDSTTTATPRSSNQLLRHITPNLVRAVATPDAPASAVDEHEEEDVATAPKVEVDTADVVQSIVAMSTETSGFERGFWSYRGSLTTPPCTEGVTWIVAKDPLRMTLDQWNQMRHVMGFNARPTQQQSGVGLSGAGSAVYGALAVAGLGALIL